MERHELTEQEAADLHTALATWRSLNKTISWSMRTLVALVGMAILWGYNAQISINQHGYELNSLRKDDQAIRDDFTQLRRDIKELTSAVNRMEQALAERNGRDQRK